MKKSKRHYEEIVAQSLKTTAYEQKQQFFREALTDGDTSSTDVEPENKKKIDSFNFSP